MSTPNNPRNKHAPATVQSPLDMRYCMVNGQLLAVAENHLSLFDRGFTLADGVVETVLIKNGEPVWWAEHEARLATAAKILAINYPNLQTDGKAEANDKKNFNEKILADIKKLWHANVAEGDKTAKANAAKASVANCVLRITLSRGVMMARGLWPIDKSDKQATTPTMAMMLYWHQPATTVAAVVTTTITRKNHHSPLTAIKWLGGYGDNLLARATTDADDALLLNTDDNLVSATVGNVFLLFADGWRTPGRQDGIIPGIARAKILSSNIITVREETIPHGVIKQARAGFISNSLGIRAIASIDGQALPDHNIAETIYKKIIRLYSEK